MIISIIAMLAIIIFKAIWLMSKAAEDFTDSMSDVQKCQRITGKKFFECSNMTKQELDSLEE